MSLQRIWEKPWGAAQLVLLVGWNLWWLFVWPLGSPADKDLVAPVILSLIALAPFALVLGVAGGFGANA